MNMRKQEVINTKIKKAMDDRFEKRMVWCLDMRKRAYREQWESLRKQKGQNK